MNKNRTDSCSHVSGCGEAQSESWSIAHFVTHTGGSGSCMSYTAPRGYSGTAEYVRQTSLHDALDQFRIALELRGPLTVDDAAWLAPELAKIIMDALA